MTKTEIVEIVAKPSFPTYAVACVGGRYIVVGGGGGASKTGIKNKIDIYELYHNGKQTVAETVMSYDIGDACVSNMVGWIDHISGTTGSAVAPTIVLAVGQDDKCVLLNLKADITLNCFPAKNSSINENLIHRVTSQRSSSDENVQLNSQIPTLREHLFKYRVEEIGCIQSVRKKDLTNKDEDIYQKVCKVSPDHRVLATGGTDGYIRFWSVLNLTKIFEFSAHNKEVDDLDFKPDGKQIVSLCKPQRECSVWNVSNGEKVTQIAYANTEVKYKFYRARYTILEDNHETTKLFTISNPLSGSKHSGLISKWCGKTYKEEKTCKLKGVLSNLSPSDDGRYLAIGSMAGGTLRYVDDAHNHFVTGLEWLPTDCKISHMVRGFSDASVLSISCDNSLKIHHVPRREMMSVWSVAVLAVFVLTGAFVFANVIGL